MISIRRGTDRGKTQRSWLESFHTFSFGDYYAPDFMGFKSLRVINEDTVQPKMGFSRHGHQNMEIISYVIEGSLSHKDSMGNGSIIRPGEIQCMSAGTGVEHSEFNHSTDELVHFLQIWIIPAKKGLSPCYQQQPISQSENELILIASNDPKSNVIHINQDVTVYTAFLQAQKTLNYPLNANRAAWLQLIKGELILNSHHVQAGDGAAIMHESIEIKSMIDSEFLLFDLV